MINITLIPAVLSHSQTTNEIGITSLELIGVVLLLILGLGITYFSFLRWNPEKAKFISSLSILGILISILIYGYLRGHLDRALDVGLEHNILLSAEVMGALVGSIFTVVLGAFLVNHLMESAEERSAIRAAVQTHYGEKVKLLEDFAHKGQKIIYYALAYRQAEEWLLRHGARESSDYAKPKYGFGLGGMDGKETLAYFNEMQQKFIEAGSLDGMARAVESTFFTSRELSSALTRSAIVLAGKSPVDLDQQLVGTGPLIEQFDRFLNPQNYKQYANYTTALRKLKEEFGVINEEYSKLIATMYDKLGDDRRNLSYPEAELDTDKQ